MTHFYPHKIHRKDYNGWAPVHEAVWSGHKKLVEFFLRNGATVHDRTGVEDEGLNLLELARAAPHMDEDHPIIQYLLEMEGAEEL
jgi:ankyrin repeat protein